jgi:uncharacterized protein
LLASIGGYSVIVIQHFIFFGRVLVKMSDGEKLIAIMLADLLQAQGVQGELNPEFVKEAICGNDLWALKWEYSGLFHDEGPDEETVRETADILTMCSFVEYSINQLAPEELEQIPEDDRQVFVGFDGNHDDHFGVAIMFIQKMKRWQEFADRGLNSHSMVLPNYRRMYPVFKSFGIRHGGFNLAEIQTILAA